MRNIAILYFFFIGAFYFSNSKGLAKDTESDPDYEAWLRNLESQIITDYGQKVFNSKNTSSKPNEEKPTGEPPVVTVKAYLLGESETEDIAENGIVSFSEEKSETTTEKIEIHYDIVDANDTNWLSRATLDNILKLGYIGNSTFHKRNLFLPTNGSGVYMKESEVGSFLSFVQRHTALIIIGCLCIIVIVAAIVICMYKSCENKKTTVTLISHHEYDAESTNYNVHKKLDPIKFEDITYYLK